MKNNDEKNGLLFDDGKKNRWKIDYMTGTGAGMSAEDREYVAGLADDMLASEQQLKQKNKYFDSLDNNTMNNYFKESQKNFLVPKNTEERRRLQFVTTPEVVDEAINDYYKETFTPNWKKQRAKADETGIEVYKSYASVPGADASLALASMNERVDPVATIDTTISGLDDDRLDAIAERYAHYAGIDAKEYRKQVLEPALRQRAIDEIVEEKKPKSGAEYFFRGVRRNSLMGSLSDMRHYGYKGSSHMYIDDMAMERYNPSRGERIAVGAGGLLFDSALFAGIGTVASQFTGKATGMLLKNATNRMIAKGLTREMAEQTAKNAILGSLKTKIAQSAMTQGLTLGTYDAAHSVVDDILHGENPDVSSAMSAFGKGYSTGAALGVVGTPLRHAARGLTGGKRLMASAGILGAESAVFTASTESAKMLEGVSIEPIDLVNDFGDSFATILAMRMFHWRPSGASNKLNTVGRLKSELRFSIPEQSEMAKAGVAPEEFVANLEKSFNVYQKGSGKAAEQVREDYIKLMSTSGLSASTRSKLLYIVENKLTSTPPEAVDYRVDTKGDDSFTLSTFDAEGQPIETVKCSSREELKSTYFALLGNLRRNRIASHERALLQSYDSQNFLRQAGAYARATGTDIDYLSDVMYRKAKKENISAEEQGMLDEILHRSNYSDSEVGQMLHSIRRSLEQEYNLNEGSLLGAIDKPWYYCSKDENMALNKYEKLMEEEVKNLHSGVSKERANELADVNNTYAGLGNSQLKEQENLDYRDMVIRTGTKMNKGSIPTFSEQFGLFSDGVYKPADWDETYVWNPNKHRHTPKDIDRMAIEAQRMGDKFGNSIEVITDESQIETSDPEYFYKVRSCGWYDEGTGRVVINLPNNQNIAEVRKTVLHEVVGHKGFSELFGYYYYDFLEEVYRRGSKEVRAAIDYQAERKGRSHHAGTDEYLAILTERVENTPEQRNILKRFCDFVREMLQRYNIYNGELNESDILSLIRRHHNAMAKRRSYDSYRSEAFRPFETAARRDGGYGNEGVAFGRYIRDMKDNPNLDGLHSGFHDFKRRMYGDIDLDQFRYRDYGHKGIKRMGNLPYYNLNRYYDAIKKKEYWSMDNVAKDFGWRTQDESGKWFMNAVDVIDRIKVYDYVYRTLRLKNPRLAYYYNELKNKPAGERTKEEENFLEHTRQTATDYDASAKVNDIMYDWLLFKSYPEIADMPVTFCKLNGRYAVYDIQNKRLLVDKKGFADPLFKDELYYTMQHVIHSIESGVVNSIGKHKTILNAVMAYNKALQNYDKSGNPQLGSNPRIAELIKEDFKMKYGVDVEDFLKLYPELEDFINKNVKLRWYDDSGESLRNYAGSTRELKKFLGGPIDLIKEVLQNPPRENDAKTLREVERERGFVSEVPSYTLPEYEYHRGRTIEEIAADINNEYGVGSRYDYLRSRYDNQKTKRQKKEQTSEAAANDETKPLNEVEERLRELSRKIEEAQQK